MTDADAQQSDTFERGDQPGKARTWWHPLLVRMLGFALDSAFKVEQEVSVGKRPLRADVLLIRRKGGSPWKSGDACFIPPRRLRSWSGPMAPIGTGRGSGIVTSQ